MRRGLYGAAICTVLLLAGCGNNAAPRPSSATAAARPAITAASATVTQPVITAVSTATPPTTAAPLAAPTRYGGAAVASQGNLHINPGQGHVAYSTDPPTSGPHFPVVPQRGIYVTPFATEYLPHFLEHGGVDVTYNKDASPAVVQKLTAIVKDDLSHSAGTDIGQVTLSPRPAMPCSVAVASWGRLETWGTASTCTAQVGNVGHDFDPNNAADVAELTRFIAQNQCRYDPENQCGLGAVGAIAFVTPVPGEPTVIAVLPTPPAR